MAYTLQSLITILQQILDSEQTRWIRFQNIPQLHSLLQKAESLQLIIEKSSLSKLKSLENQIRNAAHRAEDLIEPLMVDQMLSLPEGISFTLLPPVVEQVTQDFDYFVEQVVKLGEGNKMSSGSSSSGASLSSSKSVVVGVDEDLMQLKDRLTGMERKLEIIPIVGMGGIGKTTLAQKLYQDPLIVEHFEFLAWTTISQDYNMKSILSSLLRCILGKEFDDKHKEKESDELRDILHKSLYGRKFMIVLDDIWSTKFWDEIRRYIPDNNNGSRILITTRESYVAEYADSRSLGHQLQLLNQSKSWDLLRQIVFGEEDCPDDVLQGIGEKIASDCGGLPLAISVIGGVLSKVERSQDVWEDIGIDVRAAIAESDEQCSNILSLSYDHLSNHLRPCFLYMGAFPEDYEIRGSNLVRMWVAEGFVKENGDKSLEEEGEEYLMALVERNLVLVKELKFSGKPHTFIMHDLLRDLCISIGNGDEFLELKQYAHNPLTATGNRRRVFCDATYSPHHAYDSTVMMPHLRSFVSTYTDILSPMFFAFRLLRVLDVQEMVFEEFPSHVLQLVNLRYLAISCSSSGCLPIGISRLCNLQTLIADVESCDMPCELWEMSELRHIKLSAGILIDEDDMNRHVLKKLQTLSLVKLNEPPMRKDFFHSFPNIKKLAIYCDDESGGALDLSHLHKLEKLKCDFGYLGFLSTLRFPSNLKRLTLVSGIGFSRELSTLCDLPNLEELIIISCLFDVAENTDEEWEEIAEDEEFSDCSFESEEKKDEELEIEEDEEFSFEREEKTDEEWELGEDDEFRSLRFLQLESCTTLVHWRADETNFPVLRRLSLSCCWNLKEIPSGIGEIATLQLIEMDTCSATVVASAKHIQEVQQLDYDNYDLKLQIHERL